MRSSLRPLGAALLFGLCGCGLETLDFFGDAATGPEAATDAAATDAAADAAGDATARDGGGDGAPSSNPGKITCGALECAASGEFCCVTIADGGVAYSCASSGGACSSGIERRCDERADCTNGDVCCYEDVGGGLRADCRGDCNGRYQGCKATSECVSGSCTERSCAGFTVGACGPIPPLCP